MTFYVLGDEDVVLGFQFIGVQGVVIMNNEDAYSEFKKAVSGEYGEIGVLLITERVSMVIEEEIMNWQLSGEYPLIVEIPDLDGHLEEKKTMLESIREAIGLAV